MQGFKIRPFMLGLTFLKPASGTWFLGSPCFFLLCTSSKQLFSKFHRSISYSLFIFHNLHCFLTRGRDTSSLVNWIFLPCKNYLIHFCRQKVYSLQEPIMQKNCLMKIENKTYIILMIIIVSSSRPSLTFSFHPRA